MSSSRTPKAGAAGEPRRRLFRPAALPAFLASFCMVLAGCGSSTKPEPSTVLDYDFRTDAAGWSAAFSDYPEGREADVEFDAGIRSLPEPLDPGPALYHRGLNISDDLFMYFVRRIEGLTPGATYRLSFRIEFASNYGQDCEFGVGSSVYVKTGAAGIEPAGAPDTQGVIRLNVDKGEQRNSGANALLLGDVRNGEPGCADDLPFDGAALESGEASIDVEADGAGRMWLFFGTESAFESVHQLYFTRFRVEMRRR